MEQILIRAARRNFRLPLALALLLHPLASCFGPKSVDCPSGLVCPAGQKCAANAPVCIKGDCGDGLTQANETCDDGNVEDGDGCSKTCMSNESCGNGILDITTGGGTFKRELCDDGNNINGDGCSADCLSLELCGNSIVDRVAAEMCDDGNEMNGDGCSADCLSNEACGNGIVDIAIGEVCDDGNTTNGDACSSDCRAGNQCGNKKLDPGEQCDDGNTINDDGCTSLCQFARCGDGYLQSSTEECEPQLTPTCNYNCKFNICGDGIANARAGETCDDGNSNTCGTCSATCTSSQNTSRAIGRIVTVPANNINDGETFTFNKGRPDERIFEFDKDGSVSSNHIRIRIMNIDESDLVADAIAQAIEGQARYNNLDWLLSNRSWNVVMLESRNEGRIDDDKGITESVNVAGFSAEILSRGYGYDCPAGIKCTGDKDCKSRKCTIPPGEVTGTCQP